MEKGMRVVSKRQGEERRDAETEPEIPTRTPHTLRRSSLGNVFLDTQPSRVKLPFHGPRGDALVIETVRTEGTRTGHDG